MNLKHFYYRGYFDGRIKLSQTDKTDARKKNEEVNEKAFRLKNATLTSTEYVSPFVPTHIQSIGTIQDLRLQVQNPGLLPGIGYPHEVGYPGEFKLGFGFDHVTGLPVLPGSSVKGVLRSVFPQFKYDAEYPGNFEVEDGLQIEKSKYIVGLLRRFELDRRALTIGRAGHDEAMQFLQRLAVLGEPIREPVEQLGMGWQRAHVTEVVRCLHNSAAEVIMPDAVHQRAARVQVARIGDPPG